MRDTVLKLSLVAMFGVPAAWAAGSCESLKKIEFRDATLTAAETASPGDLKQLGVEAPDKVPAFCRVRGMLKPTSDSAIRFEVWLPRDHWNGRVLNVGNGGFAGSIEYRQMASNLRRGYATAGSDAGHQAGPEDASWAYGHPEKIADFGYRAVHLTALFSKAAVKAYYSKPQVKAYFDACSDGGREALMEAQRFPDDYDGILAGAPANNWTRMLASGLALMQSTAVNPAAYITAMKLPAINQAALEACDAQDGLKDGIVSDPEHCKFDPVVLLCKGAESDACLTTPQVASLRRIYSGAKEQDGTTLFPGLAPGDEYPAWHSWVLGEAPAASSGTHYTSGYFRYMVFRDPTWNPLTANVHEAYRTALDRTAKEVDATNPDLSQFAARGGKLVIYHGWNDPAISPWNSIGYFQQVKETMGPSRAESTVRLYMVPGMEHCAGGPGPSTLGQLGLPGADGDGSGALDLLRDWVEEGKAPGPIHALKTSGSRDTPVRIERPVCPYPQRALYDGKGNPQVPESFSCKAP